MSKFRIGEKRTVEAITTASLPDIIFMLLFFFMVTTVMREVDLKVIYNPALANQTKKLENKALVSYIYIGKPMNAEAHGDFPKIQMNDSYVKNEDVREHIELRIQELPEFERQKMTVSLKVDKKIEMGIVTDVKQSLREARALKINYSTNEGDPVREIAGL